MRCNTQWADPADWAPPQWDEPGEVEPDLALFGGRDLFGRAGFAASAVCGAACLS